jgi:hypothetical protein
MKIKSVATGYVFEAHEDAAKELLQRPDDYVKAGEKESLGTPTEAPAVSQPKPRARRRKV